MSGGHDDSPMLSVLTRIAEALERQSPPRWLTIEQASSHLGISRRRLSDIVEEAGHLDGGPVNVAAPGATNQSLRFFSGTIDDWMQRARRIAPPSRTARKGRKPSRTKGAEDDAPFDWDTVPSR